MTQLTIRKVIGREILDSRGKPTVEAEVWLEGGAIGRASVPSGASTGIAEACELRDGESRYDGMGTRKAANHVTQVLSKVVAGLSACEQIEIDRRMREADGTPNKGNLGANAILAVSLATARAAATGKQVLLCEHLRQLIRELAPERQRWQASLSIPFPMTNMISGGKHAGGNLDFQDILIMPHGAANYPEALEWIVRVYRRLGTLLTKSGFEGYLVGDEGGYGPRLHSNQQAVEMVVEAISLANLRPGQDVSLAIDVASSHFYREGSYHLAAEKGKRLSAVDMIDRLEAWVDAYPIVSIEDGLAEDDFAGWQVLTQRLGSRVKLVGDDLFATNASRLTTGITMGAANSILIKVNQIGSLSETLETLVLADKHNYGTVVSARSGETEDDFLADLSVAADADHIKVGSIARSERLSKYNQLLRLHETLG